MKVRIEQSDADEIIIRCQSMDEGAKLAQRLLDTALAGQGELALYIGNSEHYVKKDDILFFESSENKVFAHTKDRMLRTDYRLFELEGIMPSYFVRISKSVIANVKHISSLSRELTGNGTLTFSGTDKRVYFSRAYHSRLKEKIEEVRFSK